MPEVAPTDVFVRLKVLIFTTAVADWLPVEAATLVMAPEQLAPTVDVIMQVRGLPQAERFPMFQFRF